MQWWVIQWKKFSNYRRIVFVRTQQVTSLSCNKQMPVHKVKRLVVLINILHRFHTLDAMYESAMAGYSFNSICTC